MDLEYSSIYGTYLGFLYNNLLLEITISYVHRMAFPKD